MGQIVRQSTYMIQSHLFLPWDEKRKKMLKFEAYPTMCMKTKENISDRLTDPTMLMKNKPLINSILRCV